MILKIKKKEKKYTKNRRLQKIKKNYLKKETKILISNKNQSHKNK